MERAGDMEFDVAIIGAGSGGYAAARTASALGFNTVVLEGGQEVGGLCILRGCMPSKALLYAAEVMHLASHAHTWGIHTEKPRPNWVQVMARKDALIKEFADYRRSQLENGKFKFLRANAKFLDPHTLQLDDGQRLTAKHILVSTGSRVAPSPIPQLDEVGYIDSDRALSLPQLPESLIVLGGGSVATEFAQLFARFGVKVTLIQRSPHVLHEFDSDAAAVLEEVFVGEGIELYTGTQILEATRPAPGLKRVCFLHRGVRKEVVAQEILFALGRCPNTESLDLEKAGVTTDLGRVITDLQMQTNVPHIYAAGDCTGPYEIVHLAVQQGEVAAHNMAHPDKPRPMDYRLLMEVVFTDPQIASVGLTEKRAHLRDIPYIVASYPFSDHGKSLIMEAKHGFVKLLADPKTGEILGGSCVGPLGGELIHEIVTAMAKRMTVQELAIMPHYHPTLAEIWTYPAEELAEQVG